MQCLSVRLFLCLNLNRGFHFTLGGTFLDCTHSPTFMSRNHNTHGISMHRHFAPGTFSQSMAVSGRTISAKQECDKNLNSQYDGCLSPRMEFPMDGVPVSYTRTAAPRAVSTAVPYQQSPAVAARRLTSAAEDCDLKDAMGNRSPYCDSNTPDPLPQPQPCRDSQGNVSYICGDR